MESSSKSLKVGQMVLFLAFPSLRGLWLIVCLRTNWLIFYAGFFQENLLSSNVRGTLYNFWQVSLKAIMWHLGLDNKEKAS